MEKRKSHMNDVTILDRLTQAMRGDTWLNTARPNQLPPPGDWHIWLLLAGRGFGKTRAAVEWVRSQIESGKARHITVVGSTASDVRDVIVEGPAAGVIQGVKIEAVIKRKDKRTATNVNSSSPALLNERLWGLLRSSVCWH
jgi:phage terminase large subunit-like protein